MAMDVDYAATYFKCLIPSHTNGEPTNEILKRLKMELRSNGSSVDTELGGENHHYLGIILTDQDYLRISPTPTQFQAPTWPGVFIIDPAATAIKAVHAKEQHCESVHVYSKYKNAEKALLRHIQNSLHMVDKTCD